MTLEALLNDGKSTLSTLEEGALEARLLLQHVLGYEHHDMIIKALEPVSEADEALYRDLLSQRLTHKPIQHIMGYEEFYGLSFQVTKDTLIPRSETEILVDHVVHYLPTAPALVVDVGTGTGCIPLSIAYEKPLVQALGLDISKEALAVANVNAKNLELDQRVRFIESDLLGALGLDLYGKIDVLVSNPPYIPTQVVDSLDKQVKDYEPRLALDGGFDGLDYYRRLVADARPYMKPRGLVIFEIGHDQSEQVMTLFKQYGYKEVNYIEDFSGIRRIVYASWAPDH